MQKFSFKEFVRSDLEYGALVCGAQLVRLV